MIDPSQNMDRVTNLLIYDGRIAAYNAPADGQATEVIDATGRIVSPGLIDMHVHLREPGFEEDETIARPARLRPLPAALPRLPACPTPIRLSTARVVEFIRHQAARPATATCWLWLRQQEPRGQGTGGDRPTGRGRRGRL